MEYLMVPLTILAMAFIFHGFPKIHIGKKENNYYDKDETD